MAISAPVWGGQVSNARGFVKRSTVPASSPGVRRRQVSPSQSNRSSQSNRPARPAGSPPQEPRRPLPKSSRARAAERQVAAAKQEKGRAGRYLLAAVGGFLAAVLLLVGTGLSAEASRTVTETPAVSMVTVRPGDSLWTVAQRVMPEHDPRQAVEMLRQANGMKGSALTPGQQLRVP